MNILENYNIERDRDPESKEFYVVLRRDYRSHRLEILVPEPHRAIRLRCLVLDIKKLHHEVVHLDVLERVHHVGVVGS